MDENRVLQKYSRVMNPEKGGVARLCVAVPGLPLKEFDVPEGSERLSGAVHYLLDAGVEEIPVAGEYRLTCGRDVLRAEAEVFFHVMKLTYWEVPRGRRAPPASPIRSTTSYADGELRAPKYRGTLRCRVQKRPTDMFVDILRAECVRVVSATQPRAHPGT